MGRQRKKAPRDLVESAELRARQSRLVAALLIVGTVLVWLGDTFNAVESIQKFWTRVTASEAEKARQRLQLEGVTPSSEALFVAVKLARADRVAQLLAAGVDPSVQDARGWTPLHWAAYAGDLATVEALLAEMAAVVTDPWGRTALMVAAGHGHLEVLGALAAAGARVKGSEGALALFEAAAAGKLRTAEWLLTRGASPDGRGSGGWTALMAAASRGDRAMIEMLLAAGADPQAINLAGETAATLLADGLDPGLIPIRTDHENNDRGTT